LTTIIKDILLNFEETGAMSPGDVAQKLNVPRYKVLATIQCLADLGFLDPLYSRGSYKIYQISLLGKKVLDKLKSEDSLKEILEESILEESILKNKESIKAES